MRHRRSILHFTLLFLSIFEFRIFIPYFNAQRLYENYSHALYCRLLTKMEFITPFTFEHLTIA